MKLARNVGALDTLSRLKGIETRRRRNNRLLRLRPLDTLSRLKGIETYIFTGYVNFKVSSLDTLSRLKGIETLLAFRLQSYLFPLWIHFPV